MKPLAVVAAEASPGTPVREATVIADAVGRAERDRICRMIRDWNEEASSIDRPPVWKYGYTAALLALLTELEGANGE